ncbi:MAG: PD-(D/E)XK nuclease family protein [Bacillota bacterium]|nr:PD-(D/E)XK nuclease family protein [Bacillota bacterium]
MGESITKSDKNITDIIQKLKKLYKEVDKDPTITLPEIFGQQDQENFVTYWLAYLLDPQVNGFGVEPLNALLRCANRIQASGKEGIEIEKEYVFKSNGKRIDLLITTPDLVIGIENKLYSGESGEQTKFYWDGMQKLLDLDQHKGKSSLGIYLKPEVNQSEPICEGFQLITYSDLCNELRSIEYDHCRNHRKNFFFYEFLLYVEEKLMKNNETGFPNATEGIKIYYDNREMLNQVKRDYDEFVRKTKGWLNNYLKDNHCKFSSGDLSYKYWLIVENDAWRTLDFHYELLWEKSDKNCILELTKNDSVYLCAHLERASEETKNKFELDKKRQTTIYEEQIKVDFTSEEKAKESIDKIVKRLKSSVFQKYAEIANSCT